MSIGKERSKRHVQLPNDMTQKSDLEPNDLLVYVTLKRHMNKDSKECFPSLQLLSKECGFSIPTIRKSIALLTKSSYIKVRKEGRKNVYNFNKYKNFETFSYDFLDQEGAEPNEKAYVIALISADTSLLAFTVQITLIVFSATFINCSSTKNPKDNQIFIFHFLLYCIYIITQIINFVK